MADSSVSRPLPHTSDLTGCHYRLSLNLHEGRLVEPASHHEHRLPTSIMSIPGLYTVVSGPDAHLGTLETIARGESVIASAMLIHERPVPGEVYLGIDEVCHPDLLVRVDDSPQTTPPTYMPVLVVTRYLLSTHKQSRRREPSSDNAARAVSMQVRLLGVDRLGHGDVMGGTLRQTMIITDERKLRRYRPGAVKLGQAAVILHRLGMPYGLVGTISATGMNLDTRHVIIADEDSRVASYRMALRGTRNAVAAAQRRPSRFTSGTWPLTPRRIRECRACRHHDRCLDELTASDDISLLLPGDKSMRLRSVGVNTVTALAQASANTSHVSKEQVWMARARLTDVDVPRVTAKTSAPRDDVEMDIDVGACPNNGAYLRGTRAPEEDYRGFTTWEPPGPEGLGGTAEARNFMVFQDYLMRRRNAAHGQGETLRAYCWAAEGGSYWLRQSATRFGGQEFMVPTDSADLAAGDGAGSGSEVAGPTKVVRVPTREEVNKLVASEDWVDMLKVARRQILSTVGMGLKIATSWSGFHWRDTDVDGEISLDLYRITTATDLDFVAGRSFEKLTQAEAYTMLLRYNGDDCRSVAHVRDWLSSQRAVAGLLHGDDLPVPQRANRVSTCRAGRTQTRPSSSQHCE